MGTCFVIQPFDSGKFDKRFADVYKPAIEAAGLEPYRVDRDPKVDVPIDAIEGGIRDASLCLADITTDNPNVWYELGYAFASNTPVVMICSSERSSGKFPFDIQHRTIITYRIDSPSDFSELARAITERIKAYLTKDETLRQIAESDQVAPVAGLSHPEIAVLAALAGAVASPERLVSVWTLKNDAQRAGLTSIGFSLGLRRLTTKTLVKLDTYEDQDGHSIDAALLTPTGWAWIDANEAAFVTRKGAVPNEFDDDIPF